MAQPYVGEIRMFGGNFAPLDWQFCDGSLLPISGNETLFQLIGTTYGGDGQSTFAVPDLRGRLPIHMGTGTDGITYQIGEMAGVEAVTLTMQQIPSHRHILMASDILASTRNPRSARFATARHDAAYAPIASGGNVMHGQSVGFTGGSQPHGNLQPSLCVSFIISLFGIFPSPT